MLSTQTPIAISGYIGELQKLALELLSGTDKGQFKLRYDFTNDPELAHAPLNLLLSLMQAFFVCTGCCPMLHSYVRGVDVRVVVPMPDASAEKLVLAVGLGASVKGVITFQHSGESDLEAGILYNNVFGSDDF